MLVTLLTLAVGALLVPTLAVRLETPRPCTTRQALSDVTAMVLLLVYVASIPFWLRGGPQPRDANSDRRPAANRRLTAREAVPGRWPLSMAVIVLTIAGVTSAAASDWFVRR